MEYPQIDYNKKFTMQRIAYQSIISYKLIEKGFLVYGWQCLSEFAKKNGYRIKHKSTIKEIEKIGTEYDKDFCKWRNRYNIETFYNYDIGDYILIPNYKSFGIYRICGCPTDILNCDYIEELCQIKTINDETIRYDDKQGLIIDNKNELLDIGMVCKVEPIMSQISKDYMTAKLQSKFKYRGAFLNLNNSIEDLKKTFESFYNNKPVSLYNGLIENFKKTDFYNDLNDPEKLEILVKNLLLKLGADEARVADKNPSGKVGFEDCDVEANFQNLGVMIIVQCKNHEGNRIDEDWAIKQIDEYRQSREEEKIIIPWVVSMVKTFSENTLEKAQNKGIKLINQDDLIEMLINTGFTGEMEYNK